MSFTTTDRAASGSPVPFASAREARTLRELSPDQWRSGIAAWLGWFFDGLDMHLYVLVAAPFVMELLHASKVTDPQVIEKSSWIQAFFLVGWALGGGVFGRLGDKIGRSRALALTILTYAAFTGLSAFAQTWQELMAFRFLAALGIGGEWAVGSALLSETWPRRWRPWVAATLQTGVNIGVLIACIVFYILIGLGKHRLPFFGAFNYKRAVFLVGIVPAVIVFWIRKSVPEPAEWVAQHNQQRAKAPPMSDLFRGSVRGITVRTIIVCACSLTAWWAFMFWITQQIRNLPDVQSWLPSERDRLATLTFFVLIGTSIGGNYFAALLAKIFGYRRGITLMLLGFFLAMFGAFCTPRGHVSLMRWTPWVGFFSGVFGLFTMYLPPLFPTLLRTTGAGFSYNIGRLAAAFGTVFFGLFAKVGDFRVALFYNSLLFIPAMVVAYTLPELDDTKE